MAFFLKLMLLFVLTSFLTSHHTLGDQPKIQAQEAAQRFSQQDVRVTAVAAADEDIQEEEDKAIVMNDLLDELDELEKPVIVVVSDMESESKQNPTPSGISDDLRDAVIVKLEENGKKEEIVHVAAKAEAPALSTSIKTEKKPRKENINGKVDEMKDNSERMLEGSIHDDLKEEKISRKFLLEKLRKRLEKDAVYQMILRRRRKVALRNRLQAAKQMMEELEKKKTQEAEKEKELNDAKTDVSLDTPEIETIAIPPEKTDGEKVVKSEQKQTQESEKAETTGVGETGTSDLKETEQKSEVDEAKELPSEEPDELLADDETRKSKTEEEPVKSTPEVTKKPKEAEKDEENVKLEVDSIQSFEEWKNAQMQDSKSGSDPAESNGNGQRAIRTKKTQVNYASQDCGSKILSSNREAEHVSAVLEENKDLYMLNPCKANIWFVVELCEPIQVRQLQLANFELFSSAPRLFDVHISERYPAREWRHLGSFEARNSRVLQTFELEHEEMMFAKYIKFEMKSHFGNEHFCPISIVRVLGISMMEEYEELQDESSKPDHGDIIATSDDTNDNHADQVGDEQRDENPKGGINDLFSKVKHLVGNILGNGNAEDGTPQTNNNATIPNVPDEKEVVEETEEVNETTVVDRSEMNKSEEEVGGSTNEERAIVTMISTGDEESDRLIVIPSTTPPLHPLRFLSHTYNQGGPTSLLSTQICWFLEYIYRASIKRCVVSPHFNRTSCGDVFSHVIVITRPSPLLGNTTTAQAAAAAGGGEHQPRDHGATGDADSTSTNKEEAAVMGTQVNNATAPPSDGEKMSEEQVLKVLLIASDDDDKSKNEEKGVEEGPSIINPDDGQIGGSVAPNSIETNRAPIDLEPSASKSSSSSSSKSSTSQQQPPTSSATVVVGDDDSKPPQPTVTSQQQSNDGVADKKKSDGGVKEKKPTEDKVIKQQQTDTKKDNNITSAPSSSTVNKVENKAAEVTTHVISGREPGRPATTEETHQQPPQVINPGLNQKESVLMRLSNRIRSLEKNMSLSSAYLEDLSQRYKRQMDEMQRAFNRTTTRLALGARKAEENEERQQNAIDRVQRETGELREMFQEMLSSMEYLNSQMISRHLCLMAIELFILIIFMYTCASSRHKRSSRQVQLLEEKINDMQEYLLTEATKNAKPSSRLYRSKSNAETLASCTRGDERRFRDGDDDDDERGGATLTRNHSSPDLINAVNLEGKEEDKSTKSSTTTSETKTESVTAKRSGKGGKSRGSNKQTPVANNGIRNRRGGKSKRVAASATIGSPERAVQMMQDSSSSYHRHTNLTSSSSNLVSRKSKAAAQRLIYNNNNDPDLKAAGLCTDNSKSSSSSSSSYGTWLGGQHRTGMLYGKAR